MLMGREASRKNGGISKRRKLLPIDAKKAHLNHPCEENVNIELRAEVGAAAGICGKLAFWLYRFRPAAQAWESLHASRLEEVGFVRGVGNGVAFWNEDDDLYCFGA
jgi:hypothetical protein